MIVVKPLDLRSLRNTFRRASPSFRSQTELHIPSLVSGSLQYILKQLDSQGGTISTGATLGTGTYLARSLQLPGSYQSMLTGLILSWMLGWQWGTPLGSPFSHIFEQEWGSFEPQQFVSRGAERQFRGIRPMCTGQHFDRRHACHVTVALLSCCFIPAWGPPPTRVNLGHRAPDWYRMFLVFSRGKSNHS